MPSAANAKSEKPASSEATDNSPVRQILTIIEHKIRNLEKRKSKLTQYRDWQKAGKELNSDQRVAVAKYDEVNQTLEFARDLSKQVTSIAVAAERDAKKQAKKDAWVRSATETSKIREVLLILDCLMQMGHHEARDDFLNGSNGAAKLTEEDLKILDNLYPEVTPKHEPNEEGQPGFHIQTVKAAEHLCSIVDGKPKEVIGTTYSRIKEIVSTVHECGYFDRIAVETVVEAEEVTVCEEQPEPVNIEPEMEVQPPPAYPPGALPVPPAPAVVPAPAYPLRPLPPITLQEVEHAYFAQQYPQQRPISEVIGSQNFFFLQESEIDSPIGTPQPPPIPNQPSPPGGIPSQTFTNQHFIQMPPQPHFAPHPEHAAYPPALLHAAAPPHHLLQPLAAPAPVPAVLAQPPQPAEGHDGPLAASPPGNRPDNDWVESTRSPEREEGTNKIQGQGDGQNRYRRYGSRGASRGAANGHRGRGSYQGRQGGDGGYRGRQGDYQGRSKDYQNRQYDSYQNRHGRDYQSRGADDGYYGNGDTGDGQRENGRERYGEPGAGGYKGRGRGRGARPPRSNHYNNRRQDNVE